MEARNDHVYLRIFWSLLFLSHWSAHAHFSISYDNSKLLATSMLCCKTAF